MKKLTLLIAALVLSFTARATVVNCNPGTNDLAWYLTQGDTLVLADGEYIEQWSFALDKEGLVVMAAEGAKPVIKASSYLQHKATTTFIGITFDGQNAAEYASYSYENTPKSLTFINCEFKNYTTYTISASSSAHVDSLIFENCVLDGSNTTLNTIYAKGTTNTIRITDSEIKGYTTSCVTISSSSTSVNNLLIDGCTFDGGSKTLAAVQSSGIINTCEIKDSEIKGFTEYGFVANSSSAHTEELSIDNCIIHDCGYAAVYVCKASDSSEKQSCSSFELTNSTIYNVGDNTKDHGAVDIRHNENIASAQQVLIDHVTIYNFSTKTSYGGFMIYKSGNATISNCIAMNPADVYSLWINPFVAYTGATVSNCVNFNCGYVDNGATQSGLVKADPLFVDAANGNFQLYAESPAIGLGDPRWGVKPGLQPGSGKLKAAVNAAQAGDTIVLGDGEYIESIIAYNVQDLVVMAAEGTKPVVKASPYMQHYATTTFIGITFDGQDVAEYTTYSYKTDTEKDLTFINCEFKNYTKSCVTIGDGEANVRNLLVDGCSFDGGSKTPAAIKSGGIISACDIKDSEIKGYTQYGFVANSSSAHTDELSVDNTIIHDCGYSAIYVTAAADGKEKQSCSSFELTNSTIYNIGNNTKDHGAVDIRNNANITSTQQVLIDHVTLYNFNTKDWYGGFMIYQSPNATISNCIVSNPADLSGKNGYHVYGNAVVTNSLYHNCNITSGAQQTANIEADPLFVDAANANFMLSANSPAVGAGTNGSNLGDTRWGVSAKVLGKRINVTPDQASSLPWMIQSDESNVKAGDTIVLAAGTYELSSFELRKEGLVIMAAENAEVKIATKEGEYLQIVATTTFDGITFDGSNGANYAIRSIGTSAKNLIVRNCKFTQYARYNIYGAVGTHLDSLIVDNCIFSNSGAAIYFPASNLADNVPGCSYAKVTNSTLYNIILTDYVAAIDIQENESAKQSGNTEVVIDHVTIYNFSSTAKSAIKVYKSGKTNITNSIVANPAESDHYSFMIYEGAKVQNCLNFNSVGQWASNAYTDTICADPLFVDAANNNFMLQANSPAIGKATDGSNLGDPRWGVEEPQFITLTTGNNDDVIAANIGKTVNVKIERSFKANDGYYTLCVPFNMPASVIGKAYSLGTITKHVTGEGININLEEKSELSAGMPYLVLPKANMSELVVENVTILEDPVAGQGVSNDELNVQIFFQGLYSADGQTDGSIEYYVGNNGYLYNGVVEKRGLCGFFIITDKETNPINIRARVVTREEVETGLDNNQLPNTNIQKVLENGQLIIIRDGVKYNVQGQVIK